jgi:AraC-like DNA-binding protein
LSSYPEIYKPIQNGIINRLSKVISYSEIQPPEDLQHVVECFWTLKSKTQLTHEFTYTVMPDACIDIIFDVSGNSTPIIMTTGLEVENINLGTKFHFIGIRLRPGALNFTAVAVDSIIGKQAETYEIGGYNFKQTSLDIIKATTNITRLAALELLVRSLLDGNIVQKNIFVSNVVMGMQSNLAINTISKNSGYSSRQFRRKVRTQTGFSPIQLNRIVRFQNSITKNDPIVRFTDQSHLIKEFKHITKITPKQFTELFEHDRFLQ